MLSLRSLLLTALALSASAVNAAKCNEDFTIESDGDAAELDLCTKFDADLTIGPEVGSVNIPNVERITGNFIVTGASSLTSLAAPLLSVVDGDFRLKQLTVLSALNMPAITKVGKIDWETLPALKTLGFGQGITEAGSVRITDTMLGSLDGIKLTSVSTFDINNNKFLKTVEVQLTSVTEALTIAFNGKGVEASFPELKWAKNVTVRDAGLISFPKLEKVNSSIAFVNNTFETAAFPKLKSAGDFSMISCIKLTNLTANVLEQVEGTFLLANNTKLAKATNFKKLTTVLGSIDVSGALTDVEFPALDDVRGGFNLKTTEKFDCSSFDDLESGVIKGKYECEGEKDVAESADGTIGTKGDGSAASTDDDEEDAAASVAMNFGLASVLGAFALFML